MNTNDFEIFRHNEYTQFENNGKTFLLNTYPYLDIVFNDHCNAKCKFCIAHLVHDRINANIDGFKPKIRYAIQKMGVREVLLLGGEPTINDNIFEIIDYVRRFGVNKICLTTNGIRISRQPEYLERLVCSGVTHMNLSLMSLDEKKQKYINGTKFSVSMDNLKNIRHQCNQTGVKLRINNNVFIGNNDSKEEILGFYNGVKDYSDSVKFSPLLKTDSFSTVNVVTEFNREHILTDQQYDDLWHSVENEFGDCAIVRNKQTFGFVEYSMIMLPTPIIFNYNQHGKLRQKIIEERKINNLKLLPTGDLSLSWNREEKDYFINTEK